MISKDKKHDPDNRIKAASLAVVAHAFAFAISMFAVIVSAQEPDQSGQQPQVPPIEQADQLTSKATFAIYFLPGERN